VKDLLDLKAIKCSQFSRQGDYGGKSGVRTLFRVIAPVLKRLKTNLQKYFN